jgi:hypothetical protein
MQNVLAGPGIGPERRTKCADGVVTWAAEHMRVADDSNMVISVAEAERRPWRVSACRQGTARLTAGSALAASAGRKSRTFVLDER